MQMFDLPPKIEMRLNGWEWCVANDNTGCNSLMIAICHIITQRNKFMCLTYRELRNSLIKTWLCSGRSHCFCLTMACCKFGPICYLHLYQVGVQEVSGSVTPRIQWRLATCVGIPRKFLHDCNKWNCHKGTKCYNHTQSANHQWIFDPCYGTLISAQTACPLSTSKIPTRFLTRQRQ